MDVIRLIGIPSVFFYMILSIIFVRAYFNFGNRHKSFMYWAIGLVLFLGYVSSTLYRMTLSNYNPHTNNIEWLLALLGYWLIINGTIVFSKISINKRWYNFSFSLIILLIIVHSLTNYNGFFMVVIPAYLWIGITMIIVANKLLFKRKNYLHSLGIYMNVWGIIKLFTPVLIKVEVFQVTLFSFNIIAMFISGIVFMFSYVYKKSVESELDSEKFRTIFRSSSFGIELYDGAGELTYVNPSYMSIFGIECFDDIKGQVLFNSNIPEQYLILIKMGENVKFRFESDFDKVKHKANYDNNIKKRKYLDIQVDILGKDKKNPDGYLVQVQDVTDIVNNVESQRIEKERLKLVVNSANLYEWNWNLETDDFYTDPNFTMSLGYEPLYFNTTIEKIFDYLNQDDLKLLVVELNKHFIGKTSTYSCEFRIKCKDNSYKWFFGMGTVVERKENGEPLKMVGVNQSIDERKNYELKLYNSERKYRALFENMVNAIAHFEVVYDEFGAAQDFMFMEVNHAFYNVTGFSNVISKTLGEVFPIIGENWHIMFEKTVSSDKPVKFDLYSNALEKTLQGVIYPYEDNQYIAIFMDITEQKNLQEMVLQSEKLSAIGQLAGGIAHDFNNQLMGIQGSISLIKEACHNMNCNKYLYYIEKSANNAASLVNQLLAFSRKNNFEFTPVKVDSVIVGVVKLLERSIDKKIKVSTNLCAENSIVLGDENQLQNALLNIGLNARDAMLNGGEMKFETYNEFDCNEQVSYHEGEHITSFEGECLTVTISDTGIGMTDKIKKRIFEPFFTTKSTGNGTGMGLAMVFGIIKNHGGTISVRSKVSEGTKFIIRLPLVEEATYTEHKNEKKEIKSGKETIMIVDDEEIVRELLVEMIQGMGYKVVAFENGYKAIDYYSDQWRTIDLALLDIVMPDINGGELIDELHRINPNIKAGFLSGYGFEEMDKKMIKKAVGFINKPINIKDLSEEIRKMLDLRY